MGMIGYNKSQSQGKCVVCEKTFLEDELELKPYDKTKTLELMCMKCSPEHKASTLDDVRVNTEKQKEKNKMKSKKKRNKIKEVVNEQAVGHDSNAGPFVRKLSEMEPSAWDHR